MRYRYLTADVFTDRRFGGNQLAVFPDARGLSDEQMQLVAREFNFSETVFVLPAQDPAHTRRLRIFTPGKELPFAGHPTVGTAFVLAAIGEIPLVGDSAEVVFEEGVGPVRVSIRGEAGRPVFSQLSAARMPEYDSEPPPADRLAAALNLDPADILSGEYEPQAVSCGIPFLFVPLRNIDAVRRARVNGNAWRDAISAYWATEVFIFSFETELSGSAVHARMFAPDLGVAEDPATGSAAASLAGYLGVRSDLRDGTLKWRVEQGFEMGRPSILEVEADKRDGNIVAIRVGGASVMVCEGTMEIY